MEHAVGIDIGTTGISGVLIDARTGAVEKSLSCPSGGFLSTEISDEKCQDPRALTQKAFAVLAELNCPKVAAIGVTGQMHGMVYYDREGDAASPLFSWQDGRANRIYKGGKTYAQVFGAPSGYGNTTHFYNLVNGLVPRDAVGFCTISDFFVMKLTGRGRPLIHHSNAASFGRFSIELGEFDCDFTGDVTDELLPAGRVHGIPVAVAIGDNQASFLGTVRHRDGMFLNVGTGSQISMLHDGTDAHGFELRPYFEGDALLVHSALCGGKAYALLEGFFRDVVQSMTHRDPGPLYDEISALLDKKTGTDLAVSNTFCGTRTDPALRASIGNLTQDNFTAADFSAGVLAGISAELYELVVKTGIRPAFLAGAGNGIRKNAYLRREIQKRFGCKLCLAAHCEEAAYGAALSALVAAGRLSSIWDAAGLIRYEHE